MIHMIQNAKNQVLALTKEAYARAAAEGLLPEGVEVNAGVEIPKDSSNGDYTTTFALAAAKAMKKNPRELAGILAEKMELTGSYFTSVEIAGPGFLNFRLGEKWFADVLQAVETEGAEYGSGDMLKGKKIMVEFVSANPTGPMHMGNARGGVLGDTLAAVLGRCGAEVEREFYVNDAGNQIEKFANSLEARYLQIIHGEENVEFPEDGYHGDDIRELAKGFYEKHGAAYADKSVEERHAALAEFGLAHNIPKMKSDLERYGIHYDRWFFESELHNSGYVAETVEELSRRGHTYEKDGALWLKTADIMREALLKAGKKQADVDKLDLKDDVLRRANGFYTYFAADIAYHRNKYDRGFDQCINVWGADHHGHVARMKGSLDALGLNGSERLDIVLMQLVKLVRDGELVRMSKRTGKAISLTDLLDEIPVDACRYFFNMTKPDSQMEFDLGLAVREDSENPVYYVQYAHARICSLLNMMQEEGLSVKTVSEIDTSLLMGDVEKALIKQLANYCEELKIAARDYDPSHVNRYLVDLASAFHKFYNNCRIKGEDAAVAAARLKLADSVRSVLRNGMELIGCSAPERM
ncbi:MAG: arginine--tRNA ligase [Oscillospiraceae bacterium]|nr:arginine--tRNA ligase [Oscillospiraceae bacterium]